MIFQIPPKQLLSVSNCSTMRQYEILKVLSKKLSRRCPSGVSKLTFLWCGIGSGLEWLIFVGF